MIAFLAIERMNPHSTCTIMDMALEQVPRAVLCYDAKKNLWRPLRSSTLCP